MRKVLFILGELDDSDVDWLIDHGVRETHPAGTVLIEEGRRLELLYVVLDGELAVTLKSDRGRRVATLRAGEVLGELSFLDSRPPTATVTAGTEVQVLAVPRAALSAKLGEDTAFASRFYRALGIFLASRLRRTLHSHGYEDDAVLDEDVDHEDEIDPELLDGVALAGARFDWMMRRLREAPPADPDRS